MSQVALFVVNYHADEHLLRFLESVDAAMQASPDTSVSVHVLDNSTRTETELASWRQRLSQARPSAALHATGVNVGYFGHLSLAQRLVPPGTTAVVYCNPDIVLDAGFYRALAEVPDRGVLAPAIISRADGFDQNPKYTSRLTQSKLRRLRRTYSNPFLFSAFLAAGRVKELLAGKRQRHGSTTPGVRIYAPHGAMLVFSDVSFFLSLPAYPCFLFGEELFVAEEARRRRVPVTYHPALRVEDVRHASISKLPRARVRALLRDSISHILATYYGGAEGLSE